MQKVRPNNVKVGTASKTHWKKKKMKTERKIDGSGGDVRLTNVRD